jgi:hypothetical protein
MIALPPVRHYYGVDFSGAREAGRNIWVAHLIRASRDRTGAVDPSRSTAPVRPRLALQSLRRLADLAGTSERAPALAHLVGLVRGSSRAVWGFDFPFGLPVELFPAATRWAEQFAFLTEWGEEAYACGLECVARARKLADGAAHHRTALHCRRVTDVEAKAPFDTFHYRIIFQTFYGMRDVIGPLRRSRGTAVLPFQYRRLPSAERVVMECCPSTVLKSLGLPHHNYKQPAGGPLARRRRLTRHAILAGLAGRVAIADRERRTIMRNGGGDALDAVIAGVGAARAFHAADHAAIARHPRYPREGHLYR